MRNLLKLAITCSLPLAAMAVTTTGYEDFGDTAGVVLWRATTAENFSDGAVIAIAEDGTPGAEGTMTWGQFCNGQSAFSAPGKVLVYDKASSDDETPVAYTQNPTLNFRPISLGGMWVKTLAANGNPFGIVGTNDRRAEFGYANYTTLFKFEKSYTLDLQGAFTFNGTVNVDVAQDAVFSINTSYPHQTITVTSGSTLKPTGAGSITIGNIDHGLVVNGTLDLTAETRPTITGMVEISVGASLVLPSGTAIGEAVNIPVCTNLTVAGAVNVKVGDADAVSCLLTVANGNITKIEYNEPEKTFYDNWPSVVPAGCTYTFVGGATEAEMVTNNVALTVNGALKTSGYIAISSLTVAKEKTLEVLDGKTTITASAQKALSGDIRIDSGATLVNTVTDGLNYSWGVYIDIYGTLDMGSSRWTVGSNARLRLYDGGQIVGSGDGNSAIDIISANVRVIASGNATISAPFRLRANSIPFEAAEGKTLTISSLLKDNNGGNEPGSIAKQNSGTLVLTTAPTFTGEFLHEAGTLELGGTAGAANVTVSNSTATVAASAGSTLTGRLTFMSHVPSAANKSLITSDAFDGTVAIAGAIDSAVDLSGLGDEVTLKDFTGFLDKSASTSGLKLNIEGTFTQSNGWSYDSDRVYLAEIKGNGTMTQSGEQAQLYEVGSIENFTGTFNLSKARIKSNNNAVLDKAQTIATLTVAKTLTVNGGSLTGNLVASNVVVTTSQPPAEGDVIVPVSGTVSVSGVVTLNGEPVAVECVTGAGIRLKAKTATITYADSTSEDRYDDLATILQTLYMGYTSEKAGAVVTVYDGSDETFGDGLPKIYTYSSQAHTYTLKTMIVSIQSGAMTYYGADLNSVIEAATQGDVTATLLESLDMSNESEGLTIPGSVEVQGQQVDLHAVTIDLGGKTITGPANGYVLVNAGNTVTISGTGTVTGAGIVSNATSAAKTTISGGTYTATGDLFGTVEGGNIAVSGGTFNQSVADEYLANGFEVKDNGDGTYDVRDYLGWIYEAADHPGYTGSWSNEVVYSEGKAHIEDGNTYTANRPSDGRMVTVEMELSFDAVNDEDETVGDAKAAVKLATGGFKVYTSEGPDEAVTSVWKYVTIEGSDMIPVAEQDYKFLFVLDLTNTTYTAALVTGDGAATNALALVDGGVTNIPFASRGNVAPVQKIEFIGAGSVTSIEGSYEDVPAPVDVFVVDETIVLTDGSASLSADQAAWLNKLGTKSVVAEALATLSSDQFSSAYLLNLDLTDTFTYEFKVTDITVGDSSVEVEVTLTRTGTYVDGEYAINGTLTLKGTAAIGTPFETIGDAALEFDRNNNFCDKSPTSASIVTIDTSKTGAKFYKPVIE